MNRLRGFCGAKIGSKIGWKIGSPNLFSTRIFTRFCRKNPLIEKCIGILFKSERTNEINKVINLPSIANNNNMRILCMICIVIIIMVVQYRQINNFDDTYWNITTTTYRHDDATQANSAATARRPWTLVFYTAVFFHQDFLCHLG